MKQIQETAFHYIDVRPETLQAQRTVDTLKNLGLKVSCVELEPGVSSLDGRGPAESRKALEHLRQNVEKAHSVDAKAAYVRPCSSGRHLQGFAAGIAELAGHAAERGVKLCVEHVPGTALPTATEALSFIRRLNHPNLYLLLDVGHTLLSNEKPWDIVAAAGDRLGYVQMSDNDGKKDRHWALLDGRLTAEDLRRILEALTQVGYEGTLGLQLSSHLRILASDFSRNRNLLLRLQMTTEPKSMKQPEARRKQ